MCKVKYIAPLLVVLLVCSSCYNRSGRQRLARAQALLEQGYADSAANELDTLYLPREMGKEYYMQYLITKVQANYKAYRDIKRDTAIFQAVEYYEKKKNNLQQISLANCLAGCVMIERGENKKAIPYYKKALITAISANDYVQQALIYGNLGYIYDLELLEDQALNYYLQAYSTYRKQSGTEKRQIYVLNQLAKNFLLVQKPDSAFKYYHKSKEIALSLKDSNEIASVLNNIGLVYQVKAEHEKSLSVLQEALNYRLRQELKSKIYLNIASSYTSLNEYDKADKYLSELRQSIETTTDLYFKSGVLIALTNIEKAKGNYAKALSIAEENEQLQLDIFNTNQSNTRSRKGVRFFAKRSRSEKCKTDAAKYHGCF